MSNSEQLTCIVKGKVYIGFIHIKFIQDSLIKEITLNLEIHGSYKSLSDFIERLLQSLEQLNILILIVAFCFTGKSKQKCHGNLTSYKRK